MKKEVPLKCDCGKIKGVAHNISPKTGSHIVCMCDDCQTFAYYLKQSNVLNTNGGTHIFQLSHSQVEITEGHELLKSMKLSPKGTLRWYADCCKTPVANTIGFKMDFVGLIQAFIDFKNIDISKETLLGPVRYHCMAKFGKGTVPEGAFPKFPLPLTFKILKNVIKGKITKSYLPSSFFNPRNGAPLAHPEVISKDLRQSIKKLL